LKLPAIIEKYRSEVDGEIRSIFDGHHMPLYDMMRYHFGWIDENGNDVRNNAGKALRPALCLYSCEAVGGNYRRALPAAAALELVHNFSLIHDDIQDNDKERRHRPTVWAIWGQPQAINAGTAMRILANTALARYQGDGVSPQKQLFLSQRLDEISLKLIEGQFLDISFENRMDIKLENYLNMIDKKTAALISGSMEIGAFLGTDNNNSINSFKDIGANLGMAFQIRDDILGIWGKSDETGKPCGSDIRRRKKSFPIVYTLENVNGNLKKELVAYYKNVAVTGDSVDRVLEIFESAGVRRVAQESIEKYCGEAGEIFDRIEIAPDLHAQMEEVIEFLTGRNY
jgi:geranylgeranyl diphosphate synthase, type I